MWLLLSGLHLPLCFWPVAALVYISTPTALKERDPILWLLDRYLYEFCWLLHTGLSHGSFPDAWLSQFLGFHRIQPQDFSRVCLSWRGSSHNGKDSWWWWWGRGVLKKEMTVRKRGRGGWEPRLRKLVVWCKCFKPHPLRLASHSLCSQGWAWILNYPVSISQVLWLQPCATKPDAIFT